MGTGGGGGGRVATLIESEDTNVNRAVGLVFDCRTRIPYRLGFYVADGCDEDVPECARWRLASIEPLKCHELFRQAVYVRE